MNLVACRDCGSMIDPNSRGCPQCALNLEAERTIDKLLMRLMLLVIFILMLLTGAFLLFANH